MQIIWKGQNCFQIITQKTKNGQTFLVIDPFDEASGLRLSPTEAEILLFTGKYSQDNLKAIKGTPFIIDGPGEYEIKEVFIKGIPTSYDKSQNQGERTIFVIDAEEMILCHLGNLRQKELTSQQIEEIGDVDILLVPVGGDDTLNAEEARKIISQIEPKIIIPMSYRIPKLKPKVDSADKFLKEMGIKTTEILNKLSIKQKDLPMEEMRVVVLTP